MTDDTEWTRLARYFAGECTPAEADELRRWIEAEPGRSRLVEEMRAAWEAAAAPSTSWNTPASWTHLAARMRARERRAPERQGGERRAGGRRPQLGVMHAMWPGATAGSRARVARWVAAAAAVVLAVTGGLLWQRSGGAGPVRAAAAPLREIRTAAGQRIELRLADGSRVLLAPESALRYDTASFGISTRELHLEGRAYFAVAHDPRRPFLVRTAHALTEDLGTEFVITDYPSEPTTEVLVASGTVAVRNPKARAPEAATVLGRGELVRLDARGRPTVRRGVDLAAELAWTEGRLVFAATPVDEVVAQVSRWYGIDLRLGEASLGSQRFSGSYFGEPDSTVVRELAAAIGARAERRGRVITLVPIPGS